jgi:chromatin structure-remodeling complex subunit RSC1/2
LTQELRQTSFMRIVNYSRQLEPQTSMLRSPFLRGITGPGFLGEPKSKPPLDDEEEVDDPQISLLPPRRGRVSEREKRQSQGFSAAPPSVSIPPTPATGSMTANLGPTPGPSRFSHVPVTPSRPGVVPGNTQPTTQRNFASLLGGQHIMDQVALKEYLPADTGKIILWTYGSKLIGEVRLFERDSRGQVLWFSGPPLPLGTIPIPKQPAHSLEYLEYMTKRKRGIQPEDENRNRGVRYTLQSGNELNGLEEAGQEDKELSSWWTKGMDQYQIHASLKAVIDAVQ